MADTIRILYVDDEPYLLDIGRLFLERSGEFLVTTINSATAALELLNKENYDAIISDYQMPEMDGIQFLVEVRTRLGLIPFILFTGRGREEVVIEALNAGADFYLQKGGEPVAQFTELSNKVRYAVTRSRAVEELESVVDNLKRSQEVAHIGNWTLNLKTNIFDASEEALSLFGYSADQHISFQELSEKIHPDDQVQAHEALTLLIKTGKPYTIDIRIYRNDTGEMRFIQSTGQLLKSEHGDVVSVFGINLDITDRKRAEEELRANLEEMTRAKDILRENEEKFRVMSEQLPDIVLVHKDGIIVYANQAAVDKTGYTREELIGLYVLDNIVMDDREIIVRNMARRATGEEVDDYEIDMLHKSGSVRHVIVRTSPIVFNHVPSVLIILIDITERKRAEVALRESEEKYRLIFENSPLGHLSFDKNGVIVACNDKFIQIIGSSREELIGLNMLNLPDKNVVSAVKEALTGSQGLYEGDYSSVSGKKETSVRGFFAPITVGSEHIPGGVGIFEDISERKRAEEAIKTAEDTYRNIFLNSQIGLFRTDMRTGLVLDVNDTVARFIGYEDRASLLARPFNIVERYVDVYDRENIISLLQTDGEFHNYEARFRKNDGSIRWMRFSARLVREKGWVEGVSEDITEQKRSQEELRESGEKYRLLVENSHDIIYTLTVEGVFIFVSPVWTTVLGHPVKEVAGKPFQQFIHPDDIPGCMLFIQSVIRTGQRQEGAEYRVQHINGTWYWHTSSAVPIKDEAGRVTGFYGIARDITERKRAEEALIRANKKLNLLFGITRHDINNQLTVLQGYLEKIKNSQLDPILNEYFTMAVTAARRISAMIRFTKVYEQIGTNAPFWQNCQSIVDITTNQALLGQVNVENNLPSGAEVFADSLIVKVFSNLIENAVRHGGKITKIHISIEKFEYNHVIIFEDDGEGVPSEEKDKIFERGFGKNTGLGLALSREILDITGITIQETGEPGKGARFEIVIPKDAYRDNPP